MNFDGSEKYQQRYSFSGENRKKTTPITQFQPNALGLHDMSGNVWELCQDVWHQNYEGAPEDGSAWEQGGNGSQRVLRGGSWLSAPRSCRAAYRSRVNPYDRANLIGFRVVRGY